MVKEHLLAGHGYSRSMETQLVDEMKTLVLAGHETSAAMLTFATFELSRDPTLRAKVKAEADRHLPPIGKEPTREQVDKMDLTHAVLKETLRKWSVVPVITRRVAEDDTVAGFTIPKNTVINISLKVSTSPRGVRHILLAHSYMSHVQSLPYPEPKPNLSLSLTSRTLSLPHTRTRTVRFQGVHHGYWKDPTRFDPGRFLPNGEYEQFPEKQRPFMFIPFSAGPRNCLGQYLSLLEARIVLARLVQRWELQTDEVEVPQSTFVIPVASRNGVHMRVGVVGGDVGGVKR